MTEQTATAPDANEILMGGGGAPTAKFDGVGVTIGGPIVAPPRAHQEREYDPRNPGAGTPKRFPSGDPIYGLTIDVQTTLHDPTIEDDTGVRRIYVEGKRLKEAVRDAVRNAGAAKLEIGGVLHVTFTGLGEPAGAGINPPKLYTASYTPAAQATVLGNGTPAQPPQQPAQPTPSAPAAGPTADQVAALKAAGVDPATVFPGYSEPPPF